MEPPWGRWGWQGRPARSTRQSPRTASARSGSSPMRAKRLVERDRPRQKPMIDSDLVIAATGIRAEEAVWFDASYVGSYAPFGRLAPEILHVRRSDSGRSLAEHMADAGCDVAAVRSGAAYLTPERLPRYLELHIEQGPVLVGSGTPIGLVTRICGCRP